MRKVFNVLSRSLRGIRQRVGVSKSNVSEGEADSSASTEPAKWVQDATTHQDAFSNLVDPFSSMPFPEEEVVRLRKLVNRAKLKEKLLEKAESKPQTSSSGFNFDHIPISDQVVALFPGQGSQFVGMGAKLLDCPAALEMFGEASAILGYDLKQICLEGPKTKLDQTIFCQPAIFVTAMAAWEKAKAEDESLAERTTHAAGFSIGEYNALVLAKVLTFQEALRVIKIRAEAMHQCSQKIASGMLTVRVSASSQLDQAMYDARQYANEQNEIPICEVANMLFCGVKVVGASETCIKFLYENQDRYGFTILKRLSVSGAFHTRLMSDAADKLKQAFSKTKIRRPVINIYSNFTGWIHDNSSAKIRYAMVQQVANPVKWEQIQQLLFRLHQNNTFPEYMEIGPGKQLGAMLHHVSKKIMKTYKNYSC